MKHHERDDTIIKRLETAHLGDVNQMKVLVELGQEIIGDLANLSEEQKRENVELARGYLECSKQDTEATRLLYEGRVFPLSIYHLQ